MSPRPIVIAHRGASGYRPEHSQAALDLAIKQGAFAIEPDVVVSKDGVLVVRHDAELSLSTDVRSRVEFADRYTSKVVDGRVETGWFVEDFTWAELSTINCVEPYPQIRLNSATHSGEQPLLRLTDVLKIAQRASNKPTVVIELKHPSYFAALGFDMAELLGQVIADAGWKRNDPRLVVESFEKSVLIRLRTSGIATQHIYLCEHDGSAYDEVQRLGGGLNYRDELSSSGMINVAKEVTGISLDVSILLNRDGSGPALVQRAHDLGLTVYAWTLRAENKFLPRDYAQGFDPKNWGRWQDYFRRILDTGVDGIFADQPDIALQLIAEREPRP
jgi:glycerophosphoryl diester phosphodiesterase